MAQIDFDANNYEPSGTFAPIPAGWYVAHITNSAKKDAKSGGWYLWFEFEIRDGAHAKRKIWTNLNLGHAKEDVVRIAQAQFSSLCRAAGRMRVADTNELHMLPIEIKVSERPEKDGYDASNDIRGFRPVSGGQQTPPQPSAPAAGGEKPAGWKR